MKYAVLPLLLVAIVAVNAQECQRLTAPENPIWKNGYLQTILERTNVTLQQAQDFAAKTLGKYEAYDKCFGHKRVTAKLISIMAGKFVDGENSCGKAYGLREHELVKLVKSKTVGTSKTVNDVANTLQELRLIPAAPFTSFCQDSKTSALACFNDEFLRYLRTLVKKQKNGCCREMIEQNKAIFGTEVFGEFLEKVVGKAFNVACSTHNGNACAHSLLQAVVSPKKQVDNVVKTIVSWAQIPNDNACKAYTGKDYLMTTGGNTKLETPAYDCCSVQTDNLARYLMSVPALRKYKIGGKIEIFKLFEEGQHLSLDQAMDAFPFKLDIPDEFRKLAKEVKAHWPNNFHEKCSFQGTCQASLEA